MKFHWLKIDSVLKSLIPIVVSSLLLFSPQLLAATNLALNKTVTCSSVYSTNTCAKAVDGNNATFWQVNVSAAGWIKIDLGSAQTISQMVLRPTYGANKVNYTIYTSPDNVTFTARDTFANTADNVDYTRNFSPIIANVRWIRVDVSNGTPAGWYPSFYEVAVYGIQTPAAITNLVAAYSSGQFNLSWTAPSDNGSAITGYNIYYSNDGFATAGISIADSDGNATNAAATVTGIALAPAISFRVSAVNAIGTAPNSNIATVTLIPNAVTDLAASFNNGSSSFLLNWTTPNDNGVTISSYQIYYSSNNFSTAGTLVADTDGNATNATATLTGITLTPLISFKLKAVNGAGTSADSNIATVTLIPAAITNLSASYNIGSGSFLLSWTEPGNNGSAISGYQIYYSSNGFATAGTLLTDSDGSPVDATATITGLALAPSMSFRVNAVNAVGEAPVSNTAIVTFAQPAAITTLNVVPGYADGQATLTWTAPADNGEPIIDYIVEYGNGSTWQVFNDGVSTTTGTVVTGLSNTSPGLAVYFRVTTANQYLSSTSNIAHGFPFTAGNVVWVFADETYTTGNLSGGAQAKSSKSIYQDGGVEAILTTGSATTCFYGSCTAYYPSSVWLSDPLGTKTYSVSSRYNSTRAKYLYVNGVHVKTVTSQDAERVRIEKVGASIKFVINNIVQYSADISAETFTSLIANGSAGSGAASTPGAVSSAMIYGAGLQAPTTVTGLKATPGYGDAQVSLTWTAPYNNGDPITDYLVEYKTNGGWQTFTHPAITTPGITVTGLDNTLPGSAVFFRVAAVNSSGASAYSNVVHGFPFPAEDVVWWYDGESSKRIAQDGGVEASISTGGSYANGCWYGSCWSYGPPTYIGLSPPDYNQSIPKYAMHSQVNSANATFIVVNGITVTSIAGSGVVRVERVGTNIHYVMNDVVRYTVDVSTEGLTDLVADKYVQGGTLSNAKIYGAHIQAPADILDLVARPGVGYQEVGLEWTIPPANDDPISDYRVEYSIDSANGPWYTFTHSPIVSAPGDTKASILVTGLNGAVPGYADFFRVTAVNSQGISNPSNIVHGFPFIKEDVTWIKRTGSATDSGGGLLTGNGTAKSSMIIEQDGGVEANLYSGGSYSNGCWYGSCWNSTYSYVGLSPANYTGSTPKYVINSAGMSSSIKARVERVGNKIHFVRDDVVYSTLDISAEPYTPLVVHAVVTGQNSRVDATIFGATNPAIASGFNAVEPSTHNHHTDSNHPVTGTIHTKVVGKPIELNIIALKDTNSDGIGDAVEANYSTKVNRSVRVELGTIVNPNLACTAANNFQVWQPTTKVFDTTTSTYTTVNWTTGLTMAYTAADPGQKVLRFKIYGQARQGIRLRMTDVDFPTSMGCSSDEFTLRPDQYVLFVGQGDGVTVGQIPANETPGEQPLNNDDADTAPDLDTAKHKAGRPVRLRVTAVNFCDTDDPTDMPCTPQAVQNFGVDNVAPTPDAPYVVTLTEARGDLVDMLDEKFFDIDKGDAPANPTHDVSLLNGTVTMNNATYNEVGWIKLGVPTDINYAARDVGDGSDVDFDPSDPLKERGIAGTTLNVGRFTPDHFAFNTNNNMDIYVQEGIGTVFTYMGQPFKIWINNVDIDACRYDVTQPVPCNRTQNYTGSFWKLGDVADETDVSQNPVSLDISADLNHAPTSTATGSNGTVSIDYAPVSFQFNRADGTSPFTPRIDLTISGIEDADEINLGSASSQVVQIFTKQQRLGRVVLDTEKAQGPETQALSVKVTMQSFDPSNNGWTPNTDDTCGGNCPYDPEAEVFIIDHGFDVRNVVLNGGVPGDSAVLGTGQTDAVIPAWGTPENTITLTAPGAGNTGNVTVATDLNDDTTNPLPWLGGSDEEESVCFGCAAGSRNIMYQREPLR